MSKIKPTNGITNVDTAQMEQMRAQVVEQELSARSYKAYYEKMYYAIEAEKLEPEFENYKVRVKERLEKEKKAYEEFMKTMQANMASINKENVNGLVAITKDDTQQEDIPQGTPVIKMN